MNLKAPGARVKTQNSPTPRPSQNPTTSSNKYRTRDSHEMFFRPNMKGVCSHVHRHDTRSKAKSPPLADKQRAAWVRKHYEQHHGKTISPNTQVTPSTPDLTSPIILGHRKHPINNNINWSPTILDHHHHSHSHNDESLLPPIHIMGMFEYIDHLDSDHENL